MIVDNSGSMANSNKMGVAKEAAKSVVKTLGVADQFAVITFSGSATSLKGNLKRATSANIQSMESAIDKIRASGSETNYFAAFNLTFELLSKLSQSSDCNQSENIVLFLTDGKPNDDESELFQLIDNRTASLPIILFTYGLGDTVDTNLLKEMSCRYGGINFNINNANTQSKLTEVMREYYVFLSSGIKIEKPVWTEAYIDAWIEE